MTNEFSQPVANLFGLGSFDYLTAGTQPSEKGVAPAQPNTLRLYDQAGDPKWMGRFEIQVKDFSLQGYNHPEGPFSRHRNGFAWASLMTQRANELAPAPDWTQDDIFDVPGGNLVGLHSAYVFDTFFLGIGSTANKALFKQTSATNPALTAITYTPTNEICSLTRVLDDGVERLAVGRVGAPVQLMSDANGTVAITMHSSTNSCWGIILSGVTATGTPTLLMYCGTTIGTKSTDADLTTAITTTLTGLNAGGFAIGAVRPAGRDQRAYWAVPKATNSSGALKFGAEAFMYVLSTDMNGNDPLPVEFDLLPDGILGAVPYRNGLLLHDGRRDVYWDGDDEYDLGLFRARVKVRDASNQPNTTNVISGDERRRIRGLFANGPECGALWQSFDIDASELQVGYLELYNYEAGTWHNCGEPLTMASSTATVKLVLHGRGGVPVAPDTRAVFTLDTAESGKPFHRWRLPRPYESALWVNSLGSGSNTTDAFPYSGGGQIGGTLLGCRWWLDAEPPGALPGSGTIERNPKVITEVEFNGNLDHGGAGKWTFRVQVQGRGIDGTSTLTAYDQTFSQGQPSAHYRRKNLVTAMANIQDLQLLLVATGTDIPSYAIPQLLPFTVRGAYIKNVPNAPEAITPEIWSGP